MCWDENENENEFSELDFEQVQVVHSWTKTS